MSRKDRETNFSHEDEDLLRRALIAMPREPVLGKDLLPFTMTPAEMRAEAERRMKGPPESAC